MYQLYYDTKNDCYCIQVWTTHDHRIVEVIKVDARWRYYVGEDDKLAIKRRNEEKLYLSWVVDLRRITHELSIEGG